MAREVLLGAVLAAAVLFATNGTCHDVNVTWSDGWMTRTCESWPVVGYTVALGHCLNGDSERCRRALAKCTSSTTQTACTLIGAFYLGTDVSVLVATGAIGAVAGLGAEVAIKQTIKNQAIRRQCSTLTLAECSQAAVLGAVDFVASEFGGKVVRETAGLTADGIGGMVELFGGLAASQVAVTPAEFTMSRWAKLRGIRLAFVRSRHRIRRYGPINSTHSISDADLTCNLTSRPEGDDIAILFPRQGHRNTSALETSMHSSEGHPNSSTGSTLPAIQSKASRSPLSHVSTASHRPFDLKRALKLVLLLILSHMMSHLKKGKKACKEVFASTVTLAQVATSRRARNVFAANAGSRRSPL